MNQTSDEKGKRQRKKQWSKKKEEVETMFSNPWSHRNERHEHCEILDTDVLGLYELNDVQCESAWSDVCVQSGDRNEKREMCRSGDERDHTPVGKNDEGEE